MKNSDQSADVHTRVREERAALIGAAMTKIKALIREKLDRDVLEQVKTELLRVAERADLFPKEDFPSTPLGQSSLYLLSEGGRHQAVGLVK